MGRKVSDEWTVPLCAIHHRSLHSVDDEERWWKERQVDPILHAEQLWRWRWDETIQQPSNPLKKAPLPGFQPTAKHIAAKAVSPSSETMRTT